MPEYSVEVEIHRAPTTKELTIYAQNEDAAVDKVNDILDSWKDVNSFDIISIDEVY